MPAEWSITSDHASDPPAEAARYEYAEAHSLAEVNRLAGQGWQVLAVGMLPVGSRYYLLQRAAGRAPRPDSGETG